MSHLKWSSTLRHGLQASGAALQASSATQACRSQRNSRHWQRVAAVAVLLLVAVHRDVAAQDIQLARQRGRTTSANRWSCKVVASGFEPTAQVSCRLQGDPPAGITLQGPQVTQSSQSFTQIINGRMTSNESVDYRFSFVVTADREGEYAIGPFEVAFGSQVKTIAGTSFQFGKLESDPDMQIAFSLPQSSVYVGQEIPLTIRWSFVGELASVQYAVFQSPDPISFVRSVHVQGTAAQDPHDIDHRHGQGRHGSRCRRHARGTGWKAVCGGHRHAGDAARHAGKIRLDFHHMPHEKGHAIGSRPVWRHRGTGEYASDGRGHALGLRSEADPVRGSSGLVFRRSRAIVFDRRFGQSLRGQGRRPHFAHDFRARGWQRRKSLTAQPGGCRGVTRGSISDPGGAGRRHV